MKGQTTYEKINNPNYSMIPGLKFSGISIKLRIKQIKRIFKKLWKQY